MTGDGTRELVLDELIAPRSIAIVGASDNLRSWGGRALARLSDLGYPGEVFPVHPRKDEIQGYRAFPSIGDLPERPDHVVIAIGAEAALGIYEACTQLGVPAATMFAAGFGELDSAEGASLAARLQALVAAPNATRLLGPNCGGWINFAARCALTGTATLADMPHSPDGDVGIVSTSGGVGSVSVMWRAAVKGLGVRYLVTTGNEADVALGDVTLGMVQDDAIRTVLIYSEQLKNPLTLVRAAERAAETGTVLAMAKVGRTEAGRSAARSHTGAMAGDDRVWDAILAQLGIIRVDDVVDLAEVGIANLCRRSPRSHRAASIAISGGHLAVLADLASEHGLEFPALSDQTRDALQRQLPDFGEVRNPADITSAGNDAAALAAAFEVVAADEGIDLLLPLMTHAPAAMITAVADVLSRSEKYGAMIWTGGCYGSELNREDVVARGVPCFEAPGRGSLMVADLVRAHRTARAIASATDVESPADGPLPADDLDFLEQGMTRLLEGHGFRMPGQRVAHSAPEAVAAAEAIGYPVAVKLLSVKVVHKARVSALALDLATAADVARAFQRIAQIAAEHGEEPRLLVQQMVKGGLELVVGLTTVPGLGAVCMFGQGGSHVETVDDVTFWLPGARHYDVEHVVGATRVGRLLEAEFGPAGIASVQNALQRWTTFVRKHGHHFEFVDINPLVITDDQPAPLIVDVAYQRSRDRTTATPGRLAVPAVS